jgi:hypothetical protein
LTPEFRELVPVADPRQGPRVATGGHDGGEHVSIRVQLRRRREAAWSLPPLDGGHRDPLDALAAQPQASDYSLPAVELAAHVRQLRRDGWQGWEVRARFGFGMVTDAA